MSNSVQSVIRKRNSKIIALLESERVLKDGEFKQVINHFKMVNSLSDETREVVVKASSAFCGERRGKYGLDSYTHKQFAKDIGISIATLWAWKKEFEVIRPALSEESLTIFNRREIGKIANAVGIKPSPGKVRRTVRKMLNEKKSMSKEDLTLKSYLERIASVHFFITKQAIISKLSSENLDKLAFYCDEISQNIKNKKQIPKRRKPPALKRIAIKIKNERGEK